MPPKKSRSIREELVGSFLYRWKNGCFPITAESLALGDFVTLHAGDHVLDLGCGAGLLLLKCAVRCPDCVLSGIERNPDAARIAEDNLTRNSLHGTIVTGDVREMVSTVRDVQVVVSNPPWYAKGTGTDAGTAKTETCSLEEWCSAAANALQETGRFALVYAPERLSALFASLTRNRLEPKRMRLLQQRADTRPFAVLLECIKQGKPGLSVLPTCILEPVS